MGGVQVWTPATGDDLNLATTPSPASITLASDYVQGASRVIGLGMEVQNTTADIYKQGQVFTWRQPSAMGGGGVFTSQTSVAPQLTPFVGHMQRRPPANTKQEMLIPGTRQWRAEDGAYIVGTFVGQDNPPLYTSYDLPVVYDDPLVEDYPTNNGFPTTVATTYNDRKVWVPTETIPSAEYGGVPPCLKVNPMHMSGMHFSGLSQQSTLSLTVNIYLESFPGPAEPSILVLGTPSAQYDPVALEIFSHCLSSLPVGVTAGDNGFGDWFADVVRQASNYLYPIAKAFLPGQASLVRDMGRAAQKNQRYMTAQTPSTKPALGAAPARKKREKKPVSKKVVRKPKK